MKCFLVCGGAGFIGAYFVRSLLHDNHKVINLDLLTYAATLQTLDEFKKYKNYKFIKGDIRDKKKIKNVFNRFFQRTIKFFTFDYTIFKRSAFEIKFNKESWAYTPL